MLYALVSDIHANLAAWKAALADLSAMGAGRIVCLGDVVGYGPEPAEVLESAYRQVDAFVMGNHDAVVAGKMSAESFNDHAREMIEWTTHRISPRGRAFLGQQPLVLSGPDFVCAHGSLDQPAAFNYVLTPGEAIANFRATESPLVFVGHTHLPCICVLGASGRPHFLKCQDFELEPGKRYIVNVGSVGDPRGEDSRASYCLYDDARKVVSFRHVAFDYAALKEAVAKAGIRPETVALLKRDPAPTREPVREALGFAPPQSRAAMAQGVAETANLSRLKKTNHRLRNAVAVLAVVLASLAGAFTGLAARHARQASVHIPAQPLRPVVANSPADVWRNQLPPIPAGAGDLPARAVLQGWRYSLADPSRQRIRLAEDPGTGKPALVVCSDARLGFTLEAPEWMPAGLANGYRVKATVRAMRGEDFCGKAALSVVANRKAEGERTLVAGNLVLTRPGEMKPTQRTMKKSDAFRLGPQTRRIAFRIDAEFSGTLTISDPQMVSIE